MNKKKEMLVSRDELLRCLESAETAEFDFDIMLPNQPLALPNAAAGSLEKNDNNLSFEYFDIEFEKDIKKADKLDYSVAACSGILTAALDIIFIKEFSLEEAHNWGKERTECFVKAIAHHKTDYKGDDLAKAVEALEKTFPIPADELTADFGGGNWHHLRDFSHHPTVIGLCFSIITQLTGYGFGTDTDGALSVSKVSDDLRGKSFPERIVKGTIDWLFHMVSDMAGSSGRIRMGKEGTGLPGPIVSTLKELSVLPFAQNLKVNYSDSEISVSQWISKLFNGTLLAQHDENGKIIKGTELRFDLRTEMGIGEHIAKTAVPVIINECIVRAFYMFRRLFAEIRENEAKSIQELFKINPAKFLPVNNRELSRMITVSSGTFMVIVTSKDAATAIIKSKGDKKKFAAYFLLNINYFGIARFSFACKNDASYIAEDIKESYKKFVLDKKRKAIERNQAIPGMKCLALNYAQTRILYSLKQDKIAYDISCTKKEKQIAAKNNWLNSWQRIVCDEFDDEAFFIEAKDNLRGEIEQEIQTNGTNWMYLVAIELNCFEPYYLLSEKNDNPKVKLVSDYEKDVFCNVQSVIDSSELAEIRNVFSRFENSLDGKTAKRIAGAGATAIVTAATGGFALTFAPEIAVVLAGGSFAGLSGAALTSASLAAIGGGSIAAGGLGMAGGTAIIAGGGTLLGVVGSGSVAMSANLLLSSKEKTLEECTKLLTYCQLVLKDDDENLKLIKESIHNSTDRISKQIEELKKSNEKNDKAKLKTLKGSLKYLRKSEERLVKLW